MSVSTHAARFTIGTREVSPSHSPYIIAEIGVNHDGSVARARELIHAAHAAGADAAKFQMFDASMLMSLDSVLAVYQRERGAQDPRALLSALQLSPDELGSLADECVRVGITPIVTVFSLPLVEHARAQSWHAFKMASPDLVNLPLLKAIARLGRPMIVSTGAAHREEVAQAAAWLSDVANVAFLQCTSSYPTPDECAAIGGMHDIRAITQRMTGYSDHTACIDSGGLAVAAGASILEKHLTYDCNAVGPDHGASLDAAQFGAYVALARRAARMIGSHTKQLQNVEHDVRRVSRQSIVAAHDLAVGHVLSDADFCFKRPGTGICASRVAEFVGRTLLREVHFDRVLVAEDVA